MPYTAEELAEMRSWLSDCQWGDMNPEDFDDLDDTTVIDGVGRFYAGGLHQFLTDFHA